MNILVASSISKHAIDKLYESHDVICAINAPEEKLISLVADRDLIIFRSSVKISSKVMKAAKNLKFLICAGSGLDNNDVEYLTKNGMHLTQIREPDIRAIAELCFAMTADYDK
jgi:phosphoglycerate dehydrogenase-like enzyme